MAGFGGGFQCLLGLFGGWVSLIAGFWWWLGSV